MQGSLSQTQLWNVIRPAVLQPPPEKKEEAHVQVKREVILLVNLPLQLKLKQLIIPLHDLQESSLYRFQWNQWITDMV